MADFTIAWNEAVMHSLALSDTQVRNALERGAAILVHGQKRRAPVSKDGSGDNPSGWLRSHIVKEQQPDGAWKIGPRGVEYADFVNDGTRPHPIDSHGPWPLRDKYGHVFGRHVNHPGTAPTHFVQDSLEDLRGVVL